MTEDASISQAASSTTISTTMSKTNAAPTDSTPQPTQTNAATSNLTQTQSAADGTDGNSQSQLPLQIGLGVGVGVGVTLLVLAAAFLGMKLFRRRTKEPHRHPLSPPPAWSETGHSRDVKDMAPQLYEMPIQEQKPAHEVPARPLSPVEIGSSR